MSSKLSDRLDVDNICKYYNPYFGNGCKINEKCKYKHLKAKEFIGFCTRINKQNKSNNKIRNEFRMSIDLLKWGKANQAIKKFEKIIATCPYDELYNMWLNILFFPSFAHQFFLHGINDIYALWVTFNYFCLFPCVLFCILNFLFNFPVFEIVLTCSYMVTKMQYFNKSI